MFYFLFRCVAQIFFKPIFHHTVANINKYRTHCMSRKKKLLNIAQSPMNSLIWFSFFPFNLFFFFFQLSVASWRDIQSTNWRNGCTLSSWYDSSYERCWSRIITWLGWINAEQSIIILRGLTTSNRHLNKTNNRLSK